MKEELTQIRRLLISNNAEEALNRLFDITEADDKHDSLSDDIVLLQSTNSNLLENEKKHTSSTEYKLLIKEVLKIIKVLKDNDKVLPTSDTLGRNIQLITPQKKDSNSTSIAYLVPKPIDMNLDLGFHLANQCLKSYEVHVDCFYLNLETLQNLEGYDYIFIHSKTFKNKIYIENEDLESDLISLEDLEDNLISGFNGVVLITNETIPLNNLTIPLVHIKSDKPQVLKNFLFKSFKKKDIDGLNPDDFSSANLINFKISSLEKGSAQIQEPRPKLPIGLDKKVLTSFIGRTDDQARVIKKIKSLKYSGKALTIKGAGGMGKTTIVSKIAIELALRNYFKDGVNFISCEHILNYKLLEANIASCFEMDNITNFIDHIKKYNRFDKLIIIDNLESLLNLDEINEVTLVRNLISLITDYASIAITSREIIGFEFEDVLSLNKLQTDDALQLFMTNNGKIKFINQEEEKKILREDIIENLLNNNPLAIKIISSPLVLPSTKSMALLRDELEADFFSKTSSDDENPFDRKVDVNIERKTSLFHSIEYSYQKLKTTEKLAFELLHLFPDGIEMSNFRKCFSNKNNKKTHTHIKDKDISILENKSLVQLSQGVVKLQSILGRFASKKFQNRKKAERIKYYQDAYNYTKFIIDVGSHFMDKNNYSLALAICNSHINNLLFTLDYIPLLVEAKKGDKNELIRFVWLLKKYILSEGALKRYVHHLNKLPQYFEDINNSNLLFQLLEIHLLYYLKKFDDTFDSLEKLLPFSKLSELDINDEVNSNIIYYALSIYALEGYTIESIELYYKFDYYNNYSGFMLFYLGEYNIDDLESFYSFERKLNQNKLLPEELEESIDNRFERDHLGKVQNSYTLSKAIVLPLEKIDKLVITNPYTEGLKNLMFAFIEENQDKKIEYFEIAISKLIHIKYYYIEAIYFYSKYLKSITHKNFSQQFEKGKTLSKKYQYRFLIHQFSNLENDTTEPYTADSYPLVANFDFDDFVKKYNETWPAPNATKNIEKKQTRNFNSKPKPKKLMNRPPSIPTLFVEGPTDKQALNEAIKLFKPLILDKLEIHCELDERSNSKNSSDKGGGVNWVKARTMGWMANKWKIKAIALLDSDEEGEMAYKELKKEKGLGKNQTTSSYVEILKLPNSFTLPHLSHLKELNLILPVALEELFPKFCWEYAHTEGWLEKRQNIEEIVLKSKQHDKNHDGVLNFLSKKGLSNDLYLTKYIPMKNKKKFIDYIKSLPLEDKKIAFKEFEKTIIALNSFLQK